MISFGQGFVKYGGAYVNPDKVTHFYCSPFDRDNSTTVHVDNPHKSLLMEVRNNFFEVDVSSHKFAEAMVKAQQTGQIVDCEA